MKKIFLLSLITSAFLFADNVSSTPCENIQSLKIAVAKLITEQERLNLKNQNNEKSIKELQEKLKLKELPIVESVKKQPCMTKTIKVLDKDSLKFSYLKMEDKEFKVSSSVALIYEYPALGLSSIGELKKGEKFIGDMYTSGGWVHNKNGGWLKGYVLSPKIEHNESVKGGKTAYIEKEVLDCEESKIKGDNK